MYSVNKAPKGIPTKTHFQKMMYLIMKAMGNDPRATANYRPHYYGPYSDMVDEWRSSLIESGWLEKNSEERITVPRELQNEVNNIKIPDKILELQITNIVEFISSLTRNEILLYVYTDDIVKNEGMTDNSVVKIEIFSKRIQIASTMVRHNKVSIEKGAELAGLDILDFKKILYGSATS